MLINSISNYITYNLLGFYGDNDDSPVHRQLRNILC